MTFKETREPTDNQLKSVFGMLNLLQSSVIICIAWTSPLCKGVYICINRTVSLQPAEYAQQFCQSHVTNSLWSVCMCQMNFQKLIGFPLSDLDPDGHLSDYLVKSDDWGRSSDVTVCETDREIGLSTAADGPSDRRHDLLLHSLRLFRISTVLSSLRTSYIVQF